MNLLLLTIVTLLAVAEQGPAASKKEANAKSSAKGEASEKSSKAENGDKDGKAKNPVEEEYEHLLEMDDAAQKEVDGWIKQADAFAAQGAGAPRAALILKVEKRLDEVKKAYEDFLKRNPNHVEAMLAYGSFLNDTHDEDKAVEVWDKARQLDPKNPAAWNNLANFYGHKGPVDKAFEYYEKAIELDPKEPVYLQNLATTTYLFRKDAMEKYKITEKEVFDKALELYRRAIKLDPKNLLLAIDLAESYYGIQPLRTQEALDAWKYALELANTDAAKQGIYIHLARVELNSGLFKEAREHLDLVTLPDMDTLKKRLEKNLEKKKGDAEKASKPAETKEGTGSTASN